jgi:hypothetical protein
MKNEDNKTTIIYTSEKMSDRLKKAYEVLENQYAIFIKKSIKLKKAYEVLENQYAIFIKKSIKNPTSLELLHIQTDLIMSLGELVERIKAVRKII